MNNTIRPSTKSLATGWQQIKFRVVVITKAAATRAIFATILGPILGPFDRCEGVDYLRSLV